MTDFASLGIRIDSSEVSRGASELDKLTAAGAKAERAAGSMAQAQAAVAKQTSAWRSELSAGRITQDQFIEKLSGAARSLEGVKAAARSSATEYQRMGNAAAAAARASQASVQQVSAAMKAGAVSAGQMRAASQQLSFQIGDVAQQFALGAPPMRIFAAQASQVVQAIGLMSNSSKGLIGFLGGPWGAVMLGAVTILGSLWAGHGKAADGAKTQEEAARDLADAINDLHDAAVKETQSAYAQAVANIAAAESHRARATEARKAAVAELQLAKSKAVGSQAVQGGPAYFSSFQAGATGKAQSEVDRLSKEIDKLNAQIGKADETIRIRQAQGVNIKLEEALDKGAAATGKFNRAQDELFKQYRTGKITLDEFAAASMRAMQTREREEKAARDALKKPPKPKKGREDHSAERLAERLARDALAITTTISALNGLADAYLESEAAALKAEARVNAAGQAIKKQGDVEKYVAMEMQKLVAQRTVEGAKATAALGAQTAAQKAVNDAVAAGTISASQAASQLRDEAALRPLIAAAAVAEGSAKEKLLGIIARLRGEQVAANNEAARAQVLASTASAKDQLEQIRLEAKLIGATNVERAKSIALLAAEQYLKANPGASSDEARAYAQAQVDIAVATANLTTAQDNYNSSLSYTRDLLAAIGDQAGTLASILSSAFGGFGDSIGGVITALTDLQTQQQSIADWKAAETLKAGGDAKRLSQIEVLAAKASSTAQMKATGQAISGVKSLFKEKSTGFKVMQAIEMAYAAFQAANTIASMARDATQTASSVANSATRAAADQAAGGAKIFSQLGVWAFPVVAAMVAVLAALGMKGGGGGGSGPSIPSAEDLQESAGTGSVLGDAKAKSQSIANSLEIVASNTNKDLEYSNAMLAALRNIDTSIAKMAGTVARQIQVSGSLFDTSKLKLGSSGSGGFLGIGASSTTRTLWDLGINLQSASVADIIANGIAGNSYQVVQKIKKKSGFLGIGGGTKTSYKTTTGALDADIVNAIQEVVTSLRDGLLSAADVIGLTGAEAILNSFNVSLGKISFKDMTGEQIEEQLNAIFSKVGDDMAGAIFPALKEMQLIGEGLFETFIRVAREYEVVDMALKSIGRTFGMVGVASVAARDNLVQLFGGLEEFVEATTFFRDEFLSEVEQIAPIQAAVRAELERLGMAAIDTRDEFKAAVLGLDLTTQAGRDMYAALLNLAPAFDKVLDHFEQANKAQIDALQDTIDKFSGFASSLRKYRDTLFQVETAQGNAYNTLKAKFVSTASLAATGNATGLGALEGAGKDFLTASKNNASSLQQYLRDVALVARGVDKGIFAAEETVDYAQLQLDALENAATILGTIAQNTAATAQALGAPQPVAAQSTQGASSETKEAVASEVSALREDLRPVLEAIASHTFEAKQVLKRWDRGDAIAITSDSDDPLPVNLSSWG